MKGLKKIGFTVLSAVILLGAAPVMDATYAEGSKLEESKDIAVIINGKPLHSNKPVLLEGRKRFVPLRAALEQLGWNVEWEPGLITITYRTQDEEEIHYVYLEEEERIRNVNGTSYIEMFRLGELSDTEVSWSDAEGEIILTAFEEENESYEEEDEDFTELSDEETKQVNYGKYAEGSPTLDAFTDIYLKLEDDGYDPWSVIGFNPDEYRSGYFNTPLDVVTFGWTGWDGEHFGFLTDFGAATNLEEAPIVMVSPMNFDQPAIVVAGNIREFLRIAMMDFSLLYFNYGNEQEYLEEMGELASEGYAETEKDRENKRVVRERIEEGLDLPSIKDPYTYSANQRDQRAEHIIVETEDGLGIINKGPSEAGRKHSRITLDEYIGEKELTSFLQKASYASKLALFRDFHFHLEDYYYYEESIEEIIMDEMERMGLHDELARIEANRYRG
jgi:hypothetical protein